MKPAVMADRHEVRGQSHDPIFDGVALLDISLLALGDVARRQAMHDSYVVVSLMKAVSVQKEL